MNCHPNETYPFVNHPLLQPDVLTPLVHEVTQEISLADVQGRSQLILVLAKLYVLLIKMASSLLPRAGCYPVFHTMRRRENVYVEIMPNNVVKRISGKGGVGWVCGLVLSASASKQADHFHGTLK